MTGHQDHSATGKTLKGEVTYAINIKSICEAMGIKHVYEVNAFDIKTRENLVKREVQREEVSVIITKSPCVLLSKTPITKQCRINQDLCKHCGMCLRPGCPAITKLEDGSLRINDTMCNGCGLCESMCNFHAIETVEV